MRIAPHLHRIEDDMVAAYLVDIDDGIAVIDAGLPGHCKGLLTELITKGRIPR